MEWRSMTWLCQKISQQENQGIKVIVASLSTPLMQTLGENELRFATESMMSQ